MTAMPTNSHSHLWAGRLFAILLVPAAWGQEAPSAEELAKKLANPVAALISVPFQANYDGDSGPLDQGERWTLNIQPVVPISLNKDWNLISRTIVPLVDPKDIVPDAGSQSRGWRNE